MSGSDMKLVVVGAAGRMGQTLIRLVHTTPGVVLHAAVEREGSPFIGKDAGELAGLGPIGVTVGDDPLKAFLEAEGVLDFTSPASSVTFSGIAAQARIVHVIGTTGCSMDDEAKFEAAARHARIVRSGNMSLGVNLLSVLTEQAARTLGPDAWDIEILEMHHKHKVDAPSGTALLLGEAAAKGRAVDLATGARRPHGRASGRHDRLCDAARRFGDRRSLGRSCGRRRAHHALPQRRRPLDFRARRAHRCPLGARREARLLFHARRARAVEIQFLTINLRTNG
jgi:4-hydroxy-tetrahydrodipicolinate reductase